MLIAAFRMFNRYVDALPTWTPDDAGAYDEMERRIVEHGCVSPVPAPAPAD